MGNVAHVSFLSGSPIGCLERRAGETPGLAGRAPDGREGWGGIQGLFLGLSSGRTGISFTSSC